MALSLLPLLLCCQPKAADNYVEQRDGGLWLDGNPYRFVGTNFWYGPILASEGQGGDRQRLLRELDELHALGLDNLRILVGSDGEARPRHEQWQVGDPYMGDPAQEQQGLNSVFDSDSTTLKIIRSHNR